MTERIDNAQLAAALAEAEKALAKVRERVTARCAPYGRPAGLVTRLTASIYGFKNLTMSTSSKY